MIFVWTVWLDFLLQNTTSQLHILVQKLKWFGNIRYLFRLLRHLLAVFVSDMTYTNIL